MVMPHTDSAMSPIELLWTAFLPLGFSALLTLHEQPSLRSSLRLALCVVLQTLCSIYYGIYLAIYLALASVALAIRNRGVAVSRVAIALAMAAAIGLVILLPYVRMYRAANALVEHRTGEEIARFSATPLDYLRFARTRCRCHVRSTRRKSGRSTPAWWRSCWPSSELWRGPVRR